MGTAYFDAHSLWQRSEKPLYTTLMSNLEVDTCVIGGGIAGLTVAYRLIREGQRVAVLDRERLGLGETGLSSAHLSTALDEGFVELQKMHGREGAKLAAESHAQAIDLIEKIQRDEKIDCDFQRLNGYLFLHPEGHLSDLKDELTAAQESGIKDLRLLHNAPFKLFASGPCLCYPRQAQFHPLRYLEGLANAIQKRGGKIFTHTEASEIHAPKLSGLKCTVQTRQGATVEAESIVVATNVPINNWLTVHAKNSAHRSYIIGLSLPPEMAEPALLWDTAKPYHYLRLAKDPTTDEDILLVGGEDHRTGQDVDPEEHFTKLHTWAKFRLGLNSRIVTRWSGQIIEPLDGLAYIGRNPNDSANVYIVTGDSGHGLTHGTIAGILLPDMIYGRFNPWQELYDPKRLHLRSLTTYVKDITQSTIPYVDWVSQGDVQSCDEIKTGEGAILREGMGKIAVFKDEFGRLHCCSAICPHLGGIVRWNSAEKTWDCPCHGSRFDRFGEVINGPSRLPLRPIGDPLESEIVPLEG